MFVKRAISVIGAARIFALFLAAGLATPACLAADANGTFTTYGKGIASCGKYLSEKSDGVSDTFYASWLSGYLSAINESKDGVKDILQGTDLYGAIGWINNYCQQNPTDDFGTAAYKLTEYMRPKMHSDLSPPPGPDGNIFADVLVHPRNYPGSTVTPENKPPPGPSDAVEVGPLDTTPGSKPAVDHPLTLQGAKPEDVTPAEIVMVKYRGPVSLAPFTCEAVNRSSFVQRVCYDAPNSYMLINLNGTWYHYCEIDPGTVSDLMAAESMGRFYNSSIKSNFDCRTHRVPQY